MYLTFFLFNKIKFKKNSWCLTNRKPRAYFQEFFRKVRKKLIFPESKLKRKKIENPVFKPVKKSFFLTYTVHGLPIVNIEGASSEYVTC